MRDTSVNLQMIVNGDMSQATITSKAINMQGRKTAGIQAIWTGGTGVFSFKISNIPGAVKDGVVDTTKFTALVSPAAFTSIQPGGSAADAFFGFADLACLWLLVLYTKTSGTGTCNVYGEAS